MFINPKVAIEQGWVTGVTDAAAQVQPNAIDFDLAKLYGYAVDTPSFFLDGDQKQHQKTIEQDMLEMSGPSGSKMYYALKPHTAYDFASSVYVTLPAGVCAMLIVRSTLNRNGMFLTSGLYDSGFKGPVAGILHNRSDRTAYITPGSRIGQVMFLKSEDSGVLYAGGYNTEKGKHWTEPTTNTIEQLQKATTIGADHSGPVAGRQNFL
jgi:deoxycytidine triphosphate deaminase